MTETTPAVEEEAERVEPSVRVELSKELEEAQKKAAENWDLFLRTRADAENMRRRALVDIENAHKYATEKFARELLAVVDSLELGIEALIGSDKAIETSVLEGVQLTYKLLLDTLEKFGIQQMNPLNQSFDPKLHEALSTQPNNEIEPNKVLLVVQKGFLMHDRLLRPARVIVSRAIESETKV